MITVSNISKFVSGVPLYSEGTFQIYPGEKIGLVGPNGAGKTTLFRMIIGEERPDEGSISIQKGCRIAYFSQNVGEMSGRSALQEVMAGNQRVMELAEVLSQCQEELCNPSIGEDEMNDVLERMGEAQTEFERLDGYDLESRAQEVLTGLGIAVDRYNSPVESFSGGWKMRIALAKVLILLPDLILMDEPTNYLDLETIIWLEEWLKNFDGALLMTTHDRYFMNSVVKKIIEVRAGAITTFTGNYDFYEREREIRRTQNEAEFMRQQSMLKKEEEFIARFKARASHAAQVQSRVKKLDKIDRVELDAVEEEMKIYLPEIQRSGNDVASIRKLGKVWNSGQADENRVFSDLTAVVHRLDRIAVVGVNGAGKSTFLKILAQQTDATEGEAVIGASVSIGYFGQYTLEMLTPGNTVFEELRSRLPMVNDSVIRNILGSFLFRGDDVHKKVSVLSGGERARLVLAYLLSQPYNCLILDEPTNHLDIRSREVLLEALKRYEGTLLLVSHDRFFLHALSNRVFAVSSGKINVYDCDYDKYLEYSKMGV